MAKLMTQIGCLAAVLALCGCESLLGRQGLPSDPLFANRKPIETKAKVGPPTALSVTEPLPPVNPYSAIR